MGRGNCGGTLEFKTCTKDYEYPAKTCLVGKVDACVEYKNDHCKEFNAHDFKTTTRKVYRLESLTKQKVYGKFKQEEQETGNEEKSEPPAFWDIMVSYMGDKKGLGTRLHLHRSRRC